VETWLDGQPSEFFLSEQWAKKCIEHVEYLPSLAAVACFLPGQAEGLSAPPHKPGWCDVVFS